MKSYNGYLEKISSDLGIMRGNSEKDFDYNKRIIYSSICVLAYASLFDKLEDTDYVSEIHFKRRIKQVIKVYYDMYYELVKELLPDSNLDEFIDAVYEMFLNSGVIYHSPYSVSASNYTICDCKNIMLIRGQRLSETVNISGSGMYNTKDHDKSHLNIYNFCGIDQMTLSNRWLSVINDAVWIQFVMSVGNVEYLRMSDFTYGYWTDKPAINNKIISMMRTDDKINRRYYLYRIVDDRKEVSELPEWIVSNNNRWLLSNACLGYNKRLPEILYYDDGAVVHTKLQYLLPQAELNFYLFYSWPSSFVRINSGFMRRTFSKLVFNELKEMFENKGYSFKEVNDYDKWC